MIEDLSGKPEAPRVPRPESEYLKVGGDIRPEVTKAAAYQAQCTASEWAKGLRKAERIRIAVGKEQCGLCGYKAVGEWRCKESHISIEFGVLANYSCPFKGVCPGFSAKPFAPRPPQPKKKGLPVPEGVKFVYIGRPQGGSREHKGVVTVAWKIARPGILHLGFSFCSPGDRKKGIAPDPFCKIEGRNYAIESLHNLRGHKIVIPFLYSPKRTVHDVTRAVLTHDYALAPGVTMWERVPSWTKDLAKRLMGETERERRGRGKILGEKLAWLRAHGLNLGAPSLTGFPFSIASLDKIFRPPLEVEIPPTIIARMMRDIAKLGNG